VALLADAALDDGTPLDLTHSALRSVSPVHREYMRNMGTAASLTIALVDSTGLWGMLVCHHASARVVGPELRAAAGTIGQVASLLLASRSESAALAQRLERQVILRSVIDAIARPLPLPEAFAAARLPLLQLVDPGGVLLSLAGEQILLGQPHYARSRPCRRVPAMT
jgi:light-regulated signal transduction histidine kinase (bacteriophytochrome)